MDGRTRPPKPTEVTRSVIPLAGRPTRKRILRLNPMLEETDIMMHIDTIMNPKEKLRNALEAMPETASIDEILDELAILARLERSEAQADAGELLDHSEAESLVESWRTK